MFVESSDAVGSVLSIWELVNDSFLIDSSTGSWILARDMSEDGEVSFGGINSAPAESFAFYTERLAKPFSEDRTLILSDFNIFV